MLEILPKSTDMTMVVAVLIATMAFQAAVSPPGGVWQDDTSSHRAGKAVMASSHPKIYKHFMRANTTAFISSLFTIFLIFSTWGVPSVNFFFEIIAEYAMFVSLASIGVSYGASLMMTDPMETLSIGHVAAIVVSGFLILFLLLFLYGFVKSAIRKRGKSLLLQASPGGARRSSTGEIEVGDDGGSIRNKEGIEVKDTKNKSHCIGLE